jgi:predicted metal-dependent peptidase
MNLAQTKRAHNKMVRVRSHLLQDQPWWGARAMHLSLEATDRLPIMNTDGKTLCYNPEWVLQESERIIQTVVAHEVDHCVLGHPWRRGNRELQEWNIAGDFVINLSLRDAGFKLSNGVYLDERFHGWSAEQIYAYRKNQRALEQEQKQQNSDLRETDESKDSLESSEEESGKGLTMSGLKAADGSDRPCPTGEFIDSPDDPAEAAEAEMDWKVAAEQAMRVAIKAGRLPAGVQAQMDEQIRSIPNDWLGHLREFFQRLTPSNYSWIKPSRRSQNIILPGFVRDEMGTVVVAFDTSRSIGMPIYSAFAGHLAAILSEVKPQRTILIQCDAAIRDFQEFDPNDDIKVRRHGYGGTRFCPIFDWVERENIQPSALIYFTDLESSDQPEEPGYPVLWATPEWGQREGPFGRTIRVQV